MTGAELKALRKQRGLSQSALAALAGLHPDSVAYWERKPIVDLRGWAPERIFCALNIEKPSQRNAYPASNFLAQQGICRSVTRARYGVLGDEDNSTITARSLKQCCAQTRKGAPCLAKALPGKKRCKFHGGLSTGPKTKEGRERIADAQRQRWVKWRILQCQKVDN